MRLKLAPLDDRVVDGVLSEALEILDTHGVWVEHHAARELLLEAGCRQRDRRVLIPPRVVEEALKTVPRTIEFSDSAGSGTFVVGDGTSRFVPGSAALQIWDPHSRQARLALTQDLVDLARVVDSLPLLTFQSTSLVASDVPEPVADRFRLLVALLYCRKPVVTGTFAPDGFGPMRAMLECVRGGSAALAEKPLAIFDCCPSAPLSWSQLTTDALINAARARIPAELVSMPMAGATGPVTLAGCVVQHCAENLSGVVIHQRACPGAPLVWGGSPGIMDMRYGTTPMGAVETLLIDMANAQVGHRLGLPTHAYMGLSDAPWPDYQAGAESALGAAMAALAGVDIVSGAGMLSFENRQSLEKLVLDHEFIGASLRLAQGIQVHESPLASHLMGDLISRGHLLDHPHTRAWMREEHFFPGRVVERRAEAPGGAKGAHERALEVVRDILQSPPAPVVSQELKEELVAIMAHEFSRFGATMPPLP